MARFEARTAQITGWSRPALDGSSVATFDKTPTTASGTASVGGDPCTPGTPSGFTIPFNGGEFAGVPTTWDATSLTVEFTDGSTLIPPLSGMTA